MPIRDDMEEVFRAYGRVVTGDDSWLAHFGKLAL
jgi:hypothetical protein